MGLRIDMITKGSTTVVKIAGDLQGQGVRELEQTCSGVCGGLVLDLSNLTSADVQGIDMIHRLRDGGARVRNASPWIRMLLKSPPPYRNNRKHIQNK
jgi:anti-anti-sigma regulatory factor